VSGAAANVFTIPAGVSFAEALAEGMVARYGRDPIALADVTVFLPTRRGARNFSDAFARYLGGAALLPRFQPLGDVDDENLLLDPSFEGLDLPPAIEPLRRNLLLGSLIRRWSAAERKEELGFPQAVALAESLAALQDEIETHEADWTLLDNVVPSTLARHWHNVRAFLLLLKDHWPLILKEEGQIGFALRRNLALRALASALVSRTSPVIAAGSTGSIPATAELLRAIARLPSGNVILPGLDRNMDEASWKTVADDPAHPQFGMNQLLLRIGIAREGVKDWSNLKTDESPRSRLVSECLRPPPTTDAWRALADGDTAKLASGFDGLSRIEAADPSEEALVIALILRHALEDKKQTAALVTPDRVLARRVAAELKRWGIAIDDSAGRPLSSSPPGMLLNLVAECVGSHFAPIPLLAMLKHPLVVHGADALTSRRHARALDLALRGRRPRPGWRGIAHTIPETRPALQGWFEGLSQTLAPLADLMSQPLVAISDLVRAHIEAAERLASGADGKPGLLRGEAGEAAQTFLADLLDATREIPPVDPRDYPALFRSLCDRIPVRPLYGQHPGLAILGAQEARLLSFDVVVLGALNESSWPRAVAPDPWLSRPMRAAIGLDSPERAIGLAAHDFATLVAQPKVVLTRAVKVEGAPTIASRWLQRIEQLASGLNLQKRLDASNEYLRVARSMGSVGLARRASRAAPTPPVSARPRQLSITDAETWRRDPYAIYARRILNLRPLDPLDPGIGPLERGSIVHRALEQFVQDFPHDLPDGAVVALVAIADELFAQEELPNSVLAVWRPRFAHAAQWFVRQERRRRASVERSLVEIEGTLSFDSKAGRFDLVGRADRIDILKTGGVSIIDYKTGTPPTDPQIKALLALQLPLEASIVAAGGVPELGPRKPEELLYVKFSGGSPPGEMKTVKLDISAITAQARTLLETMVLRFDEPETPYISRALAYRRALQGDYDHLARVGEWSIAPLDPEEEP
jgi:ATP-dependent helicase/nuclease subunit B